MKEFDTQICVIAGGPSGLSAACQAAEDGADVILLEKAAAIGGAANMGMGPLGIGTRYQKEQMTEITVEKAFNMFMEYTHYNVDARLVKRYFEQSAETIEWLEDMGVEFEGAFRYFPKSEATWHIVKTGQKIGPRAASAMNSCLYNHALELGVEVMTSTPAKKILMEDGAVVGVLATNADGEEIKINCKAAIVCTGGGGCNPEFIKEQTGYTYGKDMFNFAIPGVTGDGIKMAWEAGAAKTQVRIEQAAGIKDADGLPPGVSSVFFQPNLLVNKLGKRFMNEDFMQNTTYLSNAVSHQKDRCGIIIVDTSIVRAYKKAGVDVVSLVRIDPMIDDFDDGIKIIEDEERSAFAVADSIEELAEMMGIDEETLVDTVDEYNDYCDTVDEEFFKDKRYLRPIAKAPFYAATIVPGGYGTVGGIKINENCQVINDDFEPIPGLYAAGADSCNLYDDSYMFLLPGNSMGYAVNSGRIAGMEAAEFIDE